ncbi:MAG: PAS domain S-box protein [Rhodomicrobium sp.]
MKRPRDRLHQLGIEDAAALLAAIVTSSSDAILSKTLDGTITSWNKATEQLFGYTAQEMVGQSIRLIIPADRQAEEDSILARIAAGEYIDNYETVRQRKDGRLVDVSVTISPVRDRSGTRGTRAPGYRYENGTFSTTSLAVSVSCVIQGLLITGNNRCGTDT